MWIRRQKCLRCRAETIDDPLKPITYCHTKSFAVLFLKLSLLILCFVNKPVYSQPEEPTLPVYRLTIEQTYLDHLEANPWTSSTFPGTFAANGSSLQCRVRYRGASARILPKKSWKIFLEGEKFEGRSEINLNSEYRDISLSRNHLCMELSRFAGIPTPETKFTSFFINDQYQGVYLDIEQVDADFLDRRHLDNGMLWKAIQHGARFAPFLRREDLFLNYEPKIRPVGAIDTLLARFTYITFAKADEIETGLDEIVYIDNFLNYFAVQYVTNNGDGFTKNYYLYRKPDGRWMLSPWDCDASLGNSWRGDWVDQADLLNIGLLAHQAVFQRLISLPGCRDRLLDVIEYLTADGLDHLARFTNETFNQIRHDVYMDIARKGSDDEFDLEFERLLGWFEDRAGYLEGLDRFNRQEIISTSVEPEYISDPADVFCIEAVLSESAFQVFAYVIDANGIEHPLELFDNGLYGDSEANDLIYTREISLPDDPAPFHYGIYVKPNPDEGYPTPPSGWAAFNQYPTPLPSVRLDKNPPQSGDFSFMQFYSQHETGTHYFGLVNESEMPLNISGCVIVIGNSFRRMQLRELPAIEPGDTLVITNHADMIAYMFRDCQITEGFYFQPEMQDTVRLVTYGGQILSSTVVQRIENASETIGPLVINEINYNSANNHDSGDWIELYCVRGDHNLGNWTLMDNLENHSYSIPENTMLRAGDYLVIAVDPVSFRQLFQDVKPVIGGFDFGFSGGGDEVCLFDEAEILIDQVRYDDDDPWPNEPDGGGPTLELINPSVPNYGPENWRSSTGVYPYGTPGKRNSTYQRIDIDNLLPIDWGIDAVYPNPFNSQVNIKWRQWDRGNIRLLIYDLLGREIRELINDRFASGWHTVTMRSAGLPAGTYILSLEFNGGVKARRVILLR